MLTRARLFFVAKLAEKVLSNAFFLSCQYEQFCSPFYFSKLRYPNPNEKRNRNYFASLFLLPVYKAWLNSDSIF